MIRAFLAATSVVLVLAGCTGSDGADDGSVPDTTVAPSPDNVEVAADDSPLGTGEERGDGGRAGSTDTGSDPGEDEAPPGAGASLGPLGDQVVEFDTEHGSVQIGSGQVPDVLAEFPVPGDLDVQLASTKSDDAGFTGVSSATISELNELYTTGLPDVGYEIADRRELSESAVIIDFAGDAGRGQVAITTSPGGDSSTLVVTFGSEGST